MDKDVSMSNLKRFIEDCRGRIDKATSAPWVWTYLGGDVVARVFRYSDFGKDIYVKDPDKEFIAASRTDLPKVIAALEAACEALDYITSKAHFSENPKWGNEFVDVAKNATARIEEILK